ncbi:MAG: Ig-like domain repeat protein [Methanobrevibacter thaueri]|uniref:Ig-like domain repeat protein n=1 Tax=Methanobrevibacter thaueri TaxID=190975 RepID=A0A8T3V3R8_9EURY|nr:Ig-like domain-containing protein [Methanobrevibacter thaueri]MBE6500961.1 Ig-like domain repeat protein [Methanobrevibacter thaueri]
MKMRKIMLITFLLLAALTIGAVSAEDNNTTSVDLQVADEGDDVIAFSGYDEYEHYIEVNEDDEEGIDLEYDEGDVATIYLPSSINKGSFRVYNVDEEIASSDIDLDDEEHWVPDEDDEDLLYGYLFVKDLASTNIKDGDTLSFKFFEYKNSQYVEFEEMTVSCKVRKTGSTMFLTEIDSLVGAEISANDIALNKTSENFTFVNVTERIGTFIITVETDDGEDYKVFKEDLATTERPYSEFDDEDGTHYYCFAFSLDDLNNYVAQNLPGADSFVDLIDKEVISSGDEMYFELLEDEADEDSEIASESWTMTIKNGKIYFDDEEYKVDVTCDDDLEIPMEGAWNETVILYYEVKKGTNGKIVICLNDNQNPAFEKTLSELEPDDEDEDYNYYDITIADLNITQAGEYVLHCYFYENEVLIYPYDDEEDPETLVLLPSQVITGDNATIIVTRFSIRVDEDKTVITINATDAQNDDEVIIYVDGNESPIRINLGNCTLEDDGIYTISSKQLNLGVGNHTLNITYKGTNAIANVTITTDLVIEIADETVYTSLNDAFVSISLVDGEITESSDITGLVNVTITDSDGNVIATIEKDINEIGYDEESLLIRTNDMSVGLNGTYNVSVRYYNGNKGLVQEEGSVTFKELSADDYGISINDVIADDKIIIFNELPFDNDILVAIDGNEPIRFDKSSLREGVDSQSKKIYFINQTQLGLTDGPHSISVSIENGMDLIPLANVNVTVDLKENIDPALTISIANIEVGNDAIVLITTNSTFTGNVLVQVAGKNLTVNVIEGKGNVSVTGLDVGTYTATATFAPNAFFLSSVKTATFNVTAKPVQPEKKDDTKPVVKKNTIKLTLKKVKVKRSAKKLVLKATLKINGKAAKGKKIIFKFKGKKYKAKTNKKGVAKVTIKKKVLKKLKRGKKVTYTAKYGKVTKKVTVKVKR